MLVIALPQQAAKKSDILRQRQVRALFDHITVVELLGTLRGCGCSEGPCVLTAQQQEPISESGFELFGRHSCFHGCRNIQ